MRLSNKVTEVVAITETSVAETAPEETTEADKMTETLSMVDRENSEAAAAISTSATSFVTNDGKLHLGVDKDDGTEYGSRSTGSGVPCDSVDHAFQRCIMHFLPEVLIRKDGSLISLTLSLYRVRQQQQL